MSFQLLRSQRCGDVSNGKYTRSFGATTRTFQKDQSTRKKEKRFATPMYYMHPLKEKKEGKDEEIRCTDQWYVGLFTGL